MSADGRSIATQPDGDIAIKEQSNVCVSVQVDQRVWPIPHLPNAQQSFSRFLAREMGRLYREKGGSYHLPGREQIPRFVSDPASSNPVCREPGEDIHITANYAPRGDGTPFVFTYRIEQGAIVLIGSATRDIEEEWRSGRLVRIHKQEPLSSAITDDMRARAASLLALIGGE